VIEAVCIKLDIAKVYTATSKRGVPGSFRPHGYCTLLLVMLMTLAAAHHRALSNLVVWRGVLDGGVSGVVLVLVGWKVSAEG
jgi:hypothetical protein